MSDNYVMDSDTLTKYNTSAKICSTVYRDIKHKIVTDLCLDVSQIVEFGNSRIEEECGRVYKREKNKGIAYPVTVSLNNCVGHYVHEEGNDRYNTIQTGDIVKVRLGVNIAGCIAMFADTFVMGPDPRCQAHLELLQHLRRTVPGMMRSGNMTDDVRCHIEATCADTGCFPVENCTSYQHLEGTIQTLDSKYIVLNYTPYFYDDDSLAVHPNDCFEFEEGEVYTVDITLAVTDGRVGYKEPHTPHLYRFNDSYYALKLKASRDFAGTVKRRHGSNAFVARQYTGDPKHRMGMKECTEHGILDAYPVLYAKDDVDTMTTCFTVVVGNAGGMSLKYV